jgi:hypothetical protein
MAQREKRSISLPPELAQAIEKEAALEGTTFSGWLAAAAAHHLRMAAGWRAFGEWEAENGPLAEEAKAEGLARAKALLEPEKPKRRRSA